jgi:hypothetical protein
MPNWRVPIGLPALGEISVMPLSEAANLSEPIKTERFFHRLRDLSLDRQIEEMQNIIVAQSRAIDSLMPRLVVLDKTYDPVQHLTWPLVQEGRRLAFNILKERPDAGTVEEEDNEMDRREMG